MQHQVETWWHELNTWNPLESRNFYRRTLGWTFEQVTLPDGEPYWLARKGGKTVGGVYNLSAPKFKGIPAHWMTYMAVDDLDRAAQETMSAGGEVTRPATDIPGIGKIAIVTDASGALIGLIEPDLEQLDHSPKLIDSDLADGAEHVEFPPNLAAVNAETTRHPLAS